MSREENQEELEKYREFAATIYPAYSHDWYIAVGVFKQYLEHKNG